MTDNPAFWPKPLLAYAERLREWQRRKRVPAMAEPVLSSLQHARKAVEKRGDAFADIDGLAAVDGCVANMLARIDDGLLGIHEEAAAMARQRSILLASAQPRPRPLQPEAAKPPERPRGRGRE